MFVRTTLAVILGIGAAAVFSSFASAQTALICSGLKGAGIDWRAGKIKRYEDGYSGTELVVVIGKKSVVITWKGKNPIRDEATIFNTNVAQGWFSFAAARLGVTRLYTLYSSSSEGFIMAITEHQTHFALQFPQSRTFFSKCK